jgi:two-component system phosphate regulon sensor histidine kinase PhoR
MRPFKCSRFWSRPGRQVSLFKRRLRLPEQRLKWMVLFFLIGVAVPLYVLFDRVYSQLRQEALYQYRLQAEYAVGLVDDDITRLMTREAKRPFTDYGFFRVEEQRLLQTKDLALSPLSEFPVSSQVPGLIGYFQISPEGVLSSPVLPDITQAQFEAYHIRFSEAEYASRLALKNRLEDVLKTDPLPIRPTPTKREDDRVPSERQPSAVTAARPSQAPSSRIAKSVGQTREETDLESAAPVAQSGGHFRSTFRGTKLAELNIDKRLYDQQQSRLPSGDHLNNASAGKRSTSDLKRQRKERIDIPANQSIEAYREFRKSKPSPENQLNDQSIPSAQPPILSFEGEIDPFQLYILQDLTLAFVRKAWKAKQRYIQGFLVDGRTFIQEVMQPRFHNSSIGPLSHWVVSYHDEVLAQLDPARHRSYWQRDATASQPASGQANALIYKTNLSTPFHDVTVHVTVPSLPLGPGAAVVHTLAILIPAILLAGAFGLYRLASQQIKLAAAQHNFVSAVSHELKTPLTSIRMYGEMLRAGWVQDDGKRQTYYDFIFFESERLSRLVANVLQLSRLTNQATPLDLQPFSPATLLDAVQANVRAQVEAAGFTLEVHNRLSPEQKAAVQVEVEEDAFTRIMINLVDNALKFSARAAHKVVCLNLEMGGDPRPLVTFSVRDYGPGIDRQHWKKIFRRFYRVGSELTRSTPGTGIGLALVKELANAMHADVDVCNHQPGAEFRLTFRPIQP